MYLTILFLFCSNLGPILISINPYKWFDIYHDAAIEKYSEARPQHSLNLQPHIFQVASRALANLLESSRSATSASGGSFLASMRNQAVIISGESGSGKTEATKLILKFLTKRTARTSNQRSVESQISLATPLLESFGNAKTVRNDNSSRFGKFIQVQFSRDGTIVGSKIKNYLLEKTRIVRQAPTERNYHIFYQILLHAPVDVLHQVGLQREASYEFLTNGIVPGADREGYERMARCISQIFVDDADERLNGIMKTLASVLHLGNLVFKPVEEGSSVEHEDDASNWVSKLLEVDEEDLVSGFCHTVMRVKDEELTIPLSVEKAELKRDALAKVLYSLLFKWLVDSLNETMKASDSQVDGEIGILDIYGFERFETNGFEQLCINFANEKLQKQYNQHVFEVEQSEYEREQIDWSYIHFQDNAPCLDLIDTGPLSLLNLLDEACLMPKGSDESLLQKLKVHAKESTHFESPRFAHPPAFILLHYAGRVQYSIAGFVQKNKESLCDSVCNLMKASRSKWFSSLVSKMAKSQSQSRSRKALRPPTISQQFRKQLNSLVSTLNSCDPHYVRCVKPNDKKKMEVFDMAKISHQLHCAGVFETLRIRAQGYAYRCSHQTFFANHRCLVPQAKDCGAMMKKISAIMTIEEADSAWQMGKTKVFLKQELADTLRTLVGIRQRRAVRCVRTAFLNYLRIKRNHAAYTLHTLFICLAFRKLKRATMVIQKWFRIRMSILRMRRTQHLVKSSSDLQTTEELNNSNVEEEEHYGDESIGKQTQNLESGGSLDQAVENPFEDPASEAMNQDLDEGMNHGLPIRKPEDSEKNELREEFEEWKTAAVARENSLKHELQTTRLKLADLASVTETADRAQNELKQITSFLQSLSKEAGITEPCEDVLKSLEMLRQRVLRKDEELSLNHEALLKDNITLVDELVDTRRKLQRTKLRLEEATAHVKQAEFANETLVSMNGP